MRRNYDPDPPTDELLREEQSPHHEFRGIQAAIEYEAPHRGIPQPLVEREPHKGMEQVLESANLEPRAEADPDGVDPSETTVLGNIAPLSGLDVQFDAQFDVGGEF